MRRSADTQSRTAFAVRGLVPAFGLALALALAAPACLAAQTSNTSPRVQTWTSSPETSESKAIGNDFCDDHGLNQSTQKVYWNGVDVTTGFPWQAASAYYNCATHATSQGSVTANLGLNTLQARVCDLLNYSYSPSGPLCTTTPIQSVRFRNVDITPKNASANKAPNRPGQYFDFTITRIVGTGSTHFGLTATCSGSVSACSVPDSVIIDNTTAPAGQLTVRVTFTTGALNTTGTVTLRATTSGVPESYNESTVTVTNYWPNVLTANTTQTNNDNQALGACAADCYAADAVASTVPYYSMGSARSVTLAYHGDRVAVRPFVYADVSLAAGADSPLRFTLQVTRAAGANIQFLNTETVLTFAPGAAMTQPVRLAGQFDAAFNSMSATGMYPATITVTAVFADHNEAQTISTKLMVVNERTSKVARGWTVAGLQRLYEQAGTDSSVLITEGDGSAVYFARNGSSYSAPPGEFTQLTVSTLLDGTRQWVRATADSTKSYFGATGLLTKIVDRFGVTIFYEYDSSDRLTKIYDPYRTVGGVRVYTDLRYNVGGYGLAAIEEPGKNGSLNGGRITLFTVNPDSTLGVVQDPDGGRTLFGYETDARRRLVTITDRRNATTTYVYRSDSSWKLAATRSPAVPIDVGGGVTRDSVLVATLDAWQTIGVPTVPTAGTPPTPVNVAAVTAAVTDAGGHAVRFTVDRWGQPLTATDAVGNVSQIVRNADGLPTRVTSATNTSTQYVYSGAFVTSVTPPSRRTTYFAYGAYGQLKQQFSDNGPVLDYFVNAAANGRLDSTKTGGQYKTAYVYDAYGRILSIADPQSHTTRFTYEPVFGNQDSVQTPLGTGIKISFDRYGRDSLRAIAGRGSVTTLYDVVNRVLQNSDGVNPRAATIAYDGEQPSRVVDPKGQLYKVSYNALGWPVIVYDPADTTRFATVTYTADGLVASRTNREGRRVTVAYDAIHRVTSRTDSLAGSTSFGYDAPGLRVVAQSRDRNGALVAMDSTFTATTGWTDSVVTWLNNQRSRRFYHMDVYGRLDSLNIISSAGVDFYSRQWYYNSTTGVIDSLGLGAKRVKLTYNTDGLRTGTQWLAGVSRTESWTAEHRPADATFSIAAINDAFKRSFNYDAQGRINVESRYSNGGNTQRNRYFQFDGLSELQRVQRDSVEYWQSCNYDAFGTYVCDLNHTTVTGRKLGLFYDEASNLRQQTDSLTNTTIAATLDAGNRLRNWDGVTYTFDRDGNVTSRSSAAGTTAFAWGGDGQLLSAAAGSDTTYYDYDAQGQVVRRRKSGNVIDRWFLWDQGQLLAELNATATSRLAEYAYDGGVDQPLALITGPTGASVVHWYEQSGHGNVDGLISTTGTVEQTLSYDEWGKLEAYSASIADSTHLRWKGLYYEGGPAALYYARARWYDPQARRFVSEDPIGLAGGINDYAFGGNDPINMSDPSGLCPNGVQCIAGMVTIGHKHVPFYPGGQSALSYTIWQLQENMRIMAERMRYMGYAQQKGPQPQNYSKQACPFTLSAAQLRAGREALRQSYRAGVERVYAVVNDATVVRVPTYQQDSVSASYHDLPAGTTTQAHGHLRFRGGYDTTYGSASDDDWTEATLRSINVVAYSIDSASLVIPNGPIFTCAH